MKENLKSSKNQEFMNYPGLSAGYEFQREIFRIPTDWWRCLRYKPISGRYEGAMTSPNSGKYVLDLRIDIDPGHANSPVMNRVSADVYEVKKYTWGKYSFNWRIYKESWIIDNPAVKWSSCSVTITGKIRFWKGYHTLTTAKIVIPWGGFKIGPAEVKLSAKFSTSDFSCTKKSNYLREIQLEVDVCDSVNDAPIVPEYDTDSHPDRPADLPQRVLTIEETYKEAGIDLSINPTNTIIDDSASQFNTWSPAELHDAMEQHFSQHSGVWPKWHLWCLLAGTFESSTVGGIMFDASASYGGAGDAPDRQGCAVFRNHSWFNNLVENPNTDAEAEAMRKYLYTYVHEIGHAFNFLHSWDKSRPDSLSWMNYDWKYDARNGSDEFWSNFRMRFDDEELIHMRHGDRASVIMGGDPWASGGHAEEPAGAMASVIGNTPLDFTIRSKGYFQFMEPVAVELRLKNNTYLPLDIDKQLEPEFGNVTIYIKRPDGRTVHYSPVLCKIATPDTTILKPLKGNTKGEDRYSKNIFLSYGSGGFYFPEPGEYHIRAVYQGDGDMLIVSGLHRIRIGRPFSMEEERIAQDYFNNDTGMALYLNGSSSPFLKNGMNVLEEISEKYDKSSVGAKISLLLAQNLSKPFFRMKNKKMVKDRDSKPDAALALTKKALDYQKKEPSAFQNIDYHDLRKTRTVLLSSMGKKKEAEKEINELVTDLKKRGVNKPVLDDIKASAKEL